MLLATELGIGPRPEQSAALEQRETGLLAGVRGCGVVGDWGRVGGLHVAVKLVASVDTLIMRPIR
jgi:hypothetical protein